MDIVQRNPEETDVKQKVDQLKNDYAELKTLWQDKFEDLNHINDYQVIFCAYKIIKNIISDHFSITLYIIHRYLFKYFIYFLFTEFPTRS